MFKWLRELLEIRYDFKAQRAKLHEESYSCKSCETLRQQLEIANYEKKNLLERILEKPVEKVESPANITPVRNRQIPWAIRKQMLEAEDREKARVMREAPTPQTTEELEKELDLAKEQNAGQYKTIE